MYRLFTVRRIGIIRLAVDKAHDVAGSLVSYLKIIRLFRKYPRLFRTVHHRTTDWTRLMTVLPAHRKKITEIAQLLLSHI